MSGSGIHGVRRAHGWGRAAIQCTELAFPCYLATLVVWCWREEKAVRDWLTMTFEVLNQS